MANGVNFSFDGPEGGASGPKGPEGQQPGDSGPSVAAIGATGGNSEALSSAIPPAVKSRRGRKAYPRDAAGNIIRPETAGTAASGPAPARAPQKGVAVRNDRGKVRQQIQGFHQVAALLTKQQILIIQDTEADALSNALCDVLDYHNIDLTSAGGAGGLYVALALTAFSIYKPRLDFIAKNGGKPVIQGDVQAARPANPAAAAADTVMGNRPMMDFTNDRDPPSDFGIDATSH